MKCQLSLSSTNHLLFSPLLAHLARFSLGWPASLYFLYRRKDKVLDRQAWLRECGWGKWNSTTAEVARGWLRHCDLEEEDGLFGTFYRGHKSSWGWVILFLLPPGGRGRWRPQRSRMPTMTRREMAKKSCHACPLEQGGVKVSLRPVVKAETSQYLPAWTRRGKSIFKTCSKSRETPHIAKFLSYLPAGDDLRGGDPKSAQYKSCC